MLLRATTRSCRIALGAVACAALASAATGAAATYESPSSAQAQAACPAGSTRAVFGGKTHCLRVGQTCTSRYKNAYARHGFRCVNGHLRKRVPPPSPEPVVTPPPPDLPPPPLPGHFKGTTSQNQDFEFDVVVDSTGPSVINFVFGSLIQTCTPEHAFTLDGFNLGTYPFPIQPSGNFAINGGGTSTNGSWHATNDVHVRGHVEGAQGTGTIELSSNLTDQGATYACTVGTLTWAVARTG